MIQVQQYDSSRPRVWGRAGTGTACVMDDGHASEQFYSPAPPTGAGTEVGMFQPPHIRRVPRFGLHMVWYHEQMVHDGNKLYVTCARGVDAARRYLGTSSCSTHTKPLSTYNLLHLPPKPEPPLYL